MGILRVNPDAEISVGFETIRPGTYRMRIVEVVDRNPEKNDLKITLEHVNPGDCINLEGQPAKAVGKLFDYVQLAADKQWKLRTLTEACGLPWSDFDPVADLPQREVDVQVKLEPYEGEQRNKVARYVVKK